MPKPGNKTAEQWERRERVSRLYLRGLSQERIASEVGASQATVSRDLTAVQAAWQQSALVDIDEARARELARIDELERTYWAEYEASKEERVITSTERTEGKLQQSKAAVRKEQRQGDPRYLSGVQWCIERRCAILGIDAPKRQEVTGAGGGAIQAEVVIDDAREGILRKLASIAAAGGADALSEQPDGE